MFWIFCRWVDAVPRWREAYILTLWAVLVCLEVDGAGNRKRPECKFLTLKSFIPPRILSIL